MKDTFTGTVSVVINAPRHNVWQALTKPEIIKQYFFNSEVKTEWKVGGPISFSGNYEGKTYVESGTILEFEPESKIRYSYLSSMSGVEDKPENHMVITYQLSANGDKTKLEIIQSNIPNEQIKTHSMENWKKVLAQLKTLVEDSTQVAAY